MAKANRPDDFEELADRLVAMERTVEELSPEDVSRREFLQAAALGAGALGVGGGTGAAAYDHMSEDASAQNQTPDKGDIGSPDDRSDVFAQDMDAVRTDTERLTNLRPAPVVEGSVSDGTQLRGAFWNVVDGTTAYHVCSEVQTAGCRVTAVDTQDVANPVILDSIDLSGGSDFAGRHITTVGHHLYAADEGGNVYAIDRSNPTNLSELSSATKVGSAFAMNYHGGYLLVYGGDTVSAVDISNPENITVAADSTDSANWDGIHPGAIVGDYLLAPDGASGDVNVIDVSDPLNATHHTTVNTGVSAHAHEVVVTQRSTVAIVPTLDESTLVALDVSDPADPTKLGDVTDSSRLSYVSSVKPIGGGDYVLTANRAGPSGESTGAVSLVDISDPSAMEIVDVVESPSLQGNNHVHYTAGGRLIASCGGDKGGDGAPDDNAANSSVTLTVPNIRTAQLSAGGVNAYEIHGRNVHGHRANVETLTGGSAYLHDLLSQTVNVNRLEIGGSDFLSDGDLIPWWSSKFQPQSWETSATSYEQVTDGDTRVSIPMQKVPSDDVDLKVGWSGVIKCDTDGETASAALYYDGDPQPATEVTHTGTGYSYFDSDVVSVARDPGDPAVGVFSKVSDSSATATVEGNAVATVYLQV